MPDLGLTGSASKPAGVQTWQVEYTATYWVEAASQEEAIERGIEVHADMPDGDWSAFVEYQWPAKVE